jgi:hypothetical protein
MRAQPLPFIAATVASTRANQSEKSGSCSSAAVIAAVAAAV